jgi:two-component system response regulator NreC
MTNGATPLRILVADSVPISRGILTALTASQISWQVCGEASDGEEAVEKAGQLGPHIVVLDIDLPKLSGLEAARRITDSYPDQRSIVLTNSDETAAVRKIFNSGAHGFLLKPNATRDLVTAIERVYGGRTFYSAKGAELVLQDCLNSAKPEETLTHRQREILALLAKEFSSTFAEAHLNRERRPRFRYKWIFAIAVAALLALSLIYAESPAFIDRSLFSLGLKSTSPRGFDGKPETQVWIDLRTALYYCPGEGRYAPNSNGRFEKQIQAQLDHFEPASGKACK